MVDELLTEWLSWLGGEPCFLIHGKGRRERRWRIIRVYAVTRRNLDSRWPFFRAACITWTSEVIAVGWDFAASVVAEQRHFPASRRHPVAVLAGRLSDVARRREAGVPEHPSASEILAHEVGHTWQALRLGPSYLPLVGAVTWFREGPHPWNHFENEASEEGLFGGLVNGSVCARLQEYLG